MSEPDRALARRLAQESLEQGDVTGWFDKLYDAADGNERSIPWADMRVHASLAEWLQREPAAGVDKRALVVGCGLGDDAEALARRGFRVTAFDVSATAIAWCRRRFGDTSVAYCIADALNLPETWRGAFELVVEAYTLQVLPPQVRPKAIEQLAGCVAPAGVLLLVARARHLEDDAGSLPWPLTKDELSQFVGCGLQISEFEDFLDRNEDPPVRRFRVKYHRGA